MAEQERFAEFVHPLIAVSIPASFLFAQGGFLSRWIPSWPLPSLAVLVLSFSVGLFSVILGNLFRKERLGFTARIRELVFFGLFLYLGASLADLISGGSLRFGTGPLGTNDGDPLRFLWPSFLNITVTVFGILQWVFSVLFQGALRDRELLLAELDPDKKNMPDGQSPQETVPQEPSSPGLSPLALQYRLRDAGILAEETLKGMRKIRNITRILLAITLAEAIGHGIAFQGEGLGAQLFVLPLFLIYPFLSGLLGRYIREQYDAGAGISPDADSRSYQIRSLFFILIVVFGIAFVAAGSTSILPIQWILAFFAWLSSLFPERPPVAFSVPEPPAEEGPDMELFRRDLEALANRSKSPVDWTFLWLILGTFAAVVAGLFILFFLISPLKSRYFWQRVRQILSPRSLLQAFKKFLSYLKPRKAKQIDGLDLDPDNLKQVREELERLTAGKQDKRKRAQLGKMAERYLRYLRWGEAHKIPCQASQAPREYAGLLTGHFPELEEPILEIAAIFEEALYGDTLISRDQWNRFGSAVGEVLHYEPEER
ncbi:DUF4129 domain-containing protein [Gracilinema caldarium]|uniref:DUF4129 domain-containing protein n=1 Tax=Gracilinema caldarium TaxID=215591 RepID=UPI0026F2C635|nr:DUF4129 domain-containing protein [Gracilinema caldarium]